MCPIRVLIADDQPIVLYGLRALFRDAPEIELLGDARTAADVTEKTLQLRPDLVVIDIAMQGLGGFDALDEIRRQGPDTRAVVFSMLCTHEHVQQAFQAGAVGYISKTQDLDDFVAILSAVHQGSTYLAPSLVGVVVDALAHAPKPSAGAQVLTSQEATVLGLLVQEKSSKAIAALLHISPRTVDTHRARIMKKLGIHTVAGLVRYALQRGQAPV